MNKHLNTLLSIIQFIAQSLSLGILIYICITHFFGLLSLDQQIDPRAFQIPYLKVLVALSFLGGLVALLIGLAQNRFKWISFFILPTREKIIFLSITLFLSFFFSATITENTYKNTIMFFIFFVFFLSLMPSLIESYLAYSLLSVIKTIGIFFHVKSRQKEATAMMKSQTAIKKTLLTIISIIIIITLLVTGGIIISDYFNGRVQKEIVLKKQLYITDLIPAKAIPTQLVTLKGYNFGWKMGGKYILKSVDGEIPTSIWQNDTIKFEVPLQLKEGKIPLWIERPKFDQDPMSKIIVSNRVILVVNSRFDLYPKANDNFMIRQWKKIKRFFLL